MRALPKSGEIWVHFKGEDKKIFDYYCSYTYGNS